MLKLTQKRVTVKRLAAEFAAAGLPRLCGVLESNRKLDSNNQVVLDASGIPVKVEPYAILKCDLLPEQEQLAKDAHTAHIADAKVTVQQDIDEDISHKLDKDVNRAMIAAMAEIAGIDESAMRDTIKSKMG